MKTIAQFPAAQILPNLGKGFSRFKLHGSIVKADSKRLQCFKLNQSCVVCGRVGTVFKLQTHAGEPPHLNLYHITTTGKAILMTRDHIIPVSRGGPDSMENSQTMCAPCNEKKGNKLASSIPEMRTEANV